MGLVQDFPYIMTREFRDKLMKEGQQSLIRIDHPEATGTGWAQRTRIFLDTLNYDINSDGVVETTPFKYKMLFITGLKIVCPAGTQFGSLLVDDRVVMSQVALQNAAGDDILLTGLGQTNANNVDNAGSLADVLGVYALPVRNEIAVWPDVIGQNETMRVFVIGYAMDRKF